MADIGVNRFRELMENQQIRELLQTAHNAIASDTLTQEAALIGIQRPTVDLEDIRGRGEPIMSRFDHRRQRTNAEQALSEVRDYIAANPEDNIPEISLTQRLDTIETAISAIPATTTSDVIDLNKMHFFRFRIPETFQIIVVGAGGTGGYVIRDLCRLIQSKQNSHNINLTIIDHDTVEDRNLLRQNFVMQDLGSPKAEVLAERYAAAFGIEVTSIVEKCTKDMLRDIIGNRTGYRGIRHPAIIIGCIDNNAARREIHNYIILNNSQFDSSNLISWIDSGNEAKSGQVVVGAPGEWCDFYLPFITQYYPEMLDAAQDPKDTRSCAERAVQDIQNIFVNVTAATHVLNFMNSIINNNRTAIHGVEFGINGASKPLYLQKAYTPGSVPAGESIWNS